MEFFLNYIYFYPNIFIFYYLNLTDILFGSEKNKLNKLYFWWPVENEKSLSFLKNFLQTITD
jgi:hypothetical protein